MTVRVLQDVAELDAASVVLGFVAQRCGPCLQQRPIWEALGVEVLVVDVDAFPELKSRFGVEALPMTVVLAQGEARESLRGVRTTRQILDVLGTPTPG